MDNHNREVVVVFLTQILEKSEYYVSIICILFEKDDVVF